MFLKDADALVDYAVDWSEVTGSGKTISTSEWRVEPDDDLAIERSDVSDALTTVRLRGGRPGKLYRVGNLVRLTDGSRDERSIVVRVEQR